MSLCRHCEVIRCATHSAYNRWKGSRASLFWGDFRLFEKGSTPWQETHSGGTSSVIIIGGHRSVTTDSAMTTTLRSRVVPAAGSRLSA
jgi:hypothetical protein